MVLTSSAAVCFRIYRICWELGVCFKFFKKPLKYSRPSSIKCYKQYGYEWDIGHFEGARRPDVNCFRSISFGQSQSEGALFH
ncbi:hypothetical protein Patl1_19439 [Pistacia atlantica]|uniref:Uncharacterized protein n=1 Tax=Pistacia atlantica TaxID=434234 RepID=A0ACC1BYC8_9ROSI|nr:hypothetical protein Patl1_19439 [Pistacia atlantica]